VGFSSIFERKCQCSSELANLAVKIEYLRRCILSDPTNRKTVIRPIYINNYDMNTANKTVIPLEKKKFKFDFRYYQENSPDYMCRNGINGQRPTTFTRADIDNVLTDHLKEVTPETVILFVPFDLSEHISDIYEFIYLLEYPYKNYNYLKDIYVNEWGHIGNIKVILYNDSVLKENKKSEKVFNTSDYDQKVYSSFLVSISEKDKIQKVTHIKSTNR
jgi:hypothetical protein